MNFFFKLTRSEISVFTGFVSVLRYKYPDTPLYCMIRQRPGNFVYTEDEMSANMEDVEWLKKAGATGFVFGALTT